jgi:hypothetical protein
MGTVCQDTHQRNYDRQPRWDRFERANLFEHYRELGYLLKAGQLGVGQVL